jgi:hypothetical protein
VAFIRLKALNKARLIARRASFVAVTRSSTRVLTAGAITLTRLLTLAVLFLSSEALHARATLATLAFACVPTGLQRAARCGAAVVWILDVDTAFEGDFLIAAWNDSLDGDQACHLIGLLILPARQLVDAMSAW